MLERKKQLFHRYKTGALRQNHLAAPRFEDFSEGIDVGYALAKEEIERLNLELMISRLNNKTNNQMQHRIKTLETLNAALLAALTKINAG